MREKISFLFLLLALTITHFLGAQEYRSIDGFNNNLLQPEWGTSNSMMAYWSKPDYADGIGQAKLDMTFNKPNPREISNRIFAQRSQNIPDAIGWSDYVWVFAQFLYNDLIQVEYNPVEILENIVVPNNDAYFPPGSVITMKRARAASGTGTSVSNPRRHLNKTTSFLDGSAIYGYDEERAQWLRGERGKLRVSEGNFLPWNTTTGEFNSPLDPSAPYMADATSSLRKMFVTGDERANETPLLLSLHTIFVREHNRLAEQFAESHPEWSDERIYQESRKWVIAFLQSIVYNEWLPTIGIKLPQYRGYHIDKNPSVSNEFSITAFKLGYSLTNSKILRLDDNGQELPQGHVSYRNAYFNPYLITLGNGVEPYLKGMGVQLQQKMDNKMVDELRNMDLREISGTLVDLAAKTINKGRDRGLPDFNTIRRDMGLPAYRTFIELTGSADEAKTLQEVYGSLEYLDPWVGMLSEKRDRNVMIGQTMSIMIERQFTDLRDSDRFYFENDPAFSSRDLNEIRNTKLQQIILRNTELTYLQKNVFISSDADDFLTGPSLEKVELNAAIYPNPTEGNAFIKVYTENDKWVQIIISNSIGQQLSSRHVQLFNGDNIIDLNMLGRTFPQGMYHVMLRHGNESNVLKVVKK
ncbi:MAG TPA: peroxidase family protein [Saprospiraceae bacterium]|nr:peroxidase family protein [Saprospiraceae bacterium]